MAGVSRNSREAPGRPRQPGSSRLATCIMASKNSRSRTARCGPAGQRQASPQDRQPWAVAMMARRQAGENGLASLQRGMAEVATAGPCGPCPPLPPSCHGRVPAAWFRTRANGIDGSFGQYSPVLPGRCRPGHRPVRLGACVAMKKAAPGAAFLNLNGRNGRLPQRPGRQSGRTSSNWITLPVPSMVSSRTVKPQSRWR